MEKDHLKTPPISRRTFLELGILSAAGSVISACFPPKTSPDQKTSIPDEKEISGLLPGNYTEFIQKHQLIPAVFNESDRPEDRLEKAVAFLRRYRQALETNPSLRGETLTAYQINTAPNYPISIPNNPQKTGSDWTIYDVVNTFLKEVESDKTVIRFSPDSFLAGTSSTFTQDKKGSWTRKTVIEFGQEIMAAKYNTEANNLCYTNFTDAEIALLLIHEYCHGLQDEKILLDLNLNPSLLSQFGTDSEKVSLWVFQQAQEHNRRLGQNFSLQRPTQKEQLLPLHYNEAQANAAQYLLLYSLNQLNHSRHSPGTNLQDPNQKELSLVQKEDPRFLNLYQAFFDIVIQTHNALDPRWLILAGK